MPRLSLAPLLAIACFGLTLEQATGQTYRYEVGGAIQSSYYLGDLGRKGVIAPQRLGLALELRRNINLRWTLASELALRGLRGSYRYAATSYPDVVTTRSFSRYLLDLSAGGEFHFFPYSEGERYLGTRSWTPVLGAGLSLASGMSDRHLQVIPALYLRLGVKLLLAPRWTMHAGWTLRRTSTDHLEGLGKEERQLSQPLGLTGSSGWKGNDSYGVWSIGISYSLSPRQSLLCK